MSKNRISHSMLLSRLLLKNWPRLKRWAWLKPLLSLLLISGISCAAISQAQPTEIDDTLRDLLKNHIEQADSFNDRFDAEAWLMLMSGRLDRYIKDEDERLHVLRQIHRE